MGPAILLPMQAILSQVFPSSRASIASHESVQELWSGYGEILRLNLCEAPQLSVIVKRIKPPRAESADVGHARKLRSYAVEQRFYQKFAPLLPPESRVPRLLWANASEGGAWLVLEDLDAPPASLGGRRSSLGDIGEIRAAVRWLAGMHRTFMGVKGEGLWEQGCYWHLDTRRNELGRISPGDELRVHAEEMDRLLKTAKHQTVLHGDAKVANFCFPERGGQGEATVAAVDFQYAGMGVGVRDLAYFMGSCMAEQELRRSAEGLLDYYFEHLRAGGPCEAEWRRLWPVCWADFDRFLAGWAPGHWKRANSYAASMRDTAIAQIQGQC